MGINKNLTKAVKATAATATKPPSNAKGSEVTMDKSGNKLEPQRGQTPRKDIAKSPTTRRRVVGKESDGEVVKAFGKKS